MNEFLYGLILGVIFGYASCMYRVNKLQEEVNNLKIDALHESKRGE